MSDNEEKHEASPAVSPTASGTLARDFMASLVVFLVALPLCMGIALVSGVPVALGLVTGIIGGLIVGFLAGQPLQVSGPAAGLAMMVAELVETFGLAALGLAVLIAGIIQLGAGILRLGRWFRAVSPAVILGMLAGIGVSIFASQFHYMVDDPVKGTTLNHLLTIPSAIEKGIFPLDGSQHNWAAAIGLITILSLAFWNRLRPNMLRMLPGPLVGVVGAVAVAAALGLSIEFVQVPSDMLDALNWVQADSLSLLSNSSFWVAAVGLAVIASAETLLCATAVDRMHDGERTKYDKELRAQGIGNILCGVVGALPMTGVIVRSSANVEAGGQTKWSAIFHGAWILILVAVFPVVLAVIPRASLAAILVFTGWKLLNLPAVRQLAKKGMSEVLIWAATVIAIVSTNLLVGVGLGFGLALLRLLILFARFDVETRIDGNRYDVDLDGASTFMSLPKLAEALEAIPPEAEVHVHLDQLTYIDHACLELIEDWHTRHKGQVSLEFARLEARNRTGSHRVVA